MEGLVLYFSLILARVGTFVAILPLFGSQTLPRMVKVGLAFALAVMYFSCFFGEIPIGELLRRSGSTSWLAFVIAMGREAILGALLGLALGLFLLPARLAGDFVTQELGLTFGALLGPTEAAPPGTGSLTQIIEALSALIFFALDGHHVFFAVLHATFLRYPIGGAVPQVPVQHLISGVSAAQEWGLLLVAPVVLCLFLTTVILSLMTRGAPQLNLFSIGFPLRLLAGLVALWALAPNWVGALVSVFGRISELVLQLV